MSGPEDCRPASRPCGHVILAMCAPEQSAPNRVAALFGVVDRLAFVKRSITRRGIIQVQIPPVPFDQKRMRRKARCEMSSAVHLPCFKQSSSFETYSSLRRTRRGLAGRSSTCTSAVSPDICKRSRMLMSQTLTERAEFNACTSKGVDPRSTCPKRPPKMISSNANPESPMSCPSNVQVPMCGGVVRF